ncbi:uncharacterized protein SAPINGB_P000910 [Magnusiomyces paraingens]|uniref:Superoxide dismutase [Cu-Zn] n=1 Tax=Magnusiomyces paraingens TaxID=2606893 RepID=A0A5E8B2Y3_9ASCO|nr:uncharacterized protein SAPINGB_P000910 [Saprochaete ingens]VVT45826.1 unnamed protein product [Saprochaete ingens]
MVTAVAVISGNSTVTGTITFNQASAAEQINIAWNITGSTPNSLRGFHVHAYGDLTNGCASTGSHFNPLNETHGAPSDSVRHFGDLGNIWTDASGASLGSTTDRLLTLFGENSILGRAVVVHTGTDDLGKGGNADSLKTGNAGGRAACGIIGIAPTPSNTGTTTAVTTVTVTVAGTDCATAAEATSTASK